MAADELSIRCVLCDDGGPLADFAADVGDRMAMWCHTCGSMTVGRVVPAE